MILSASRRTDIPSFYGRWFLNRLQAGLFDVRNPFNSKIISEIHVSPEEVDCIVFWTKNPEPFISDLDVLDAMGYQYYFQFTITPYSADIEENVPDKRRILETCIRLSEKIGREKIILRYDPVLLTKRYSLTFHYEMFEKMCALLEGRCHKITISFLDEYRKINGAMKRHGIRGLTPEEMIEVGAHFASTATRFSYSIETCAEEIDLNCFGIGHAKCIDRDYIERITNRNLKVENQQETRVAAKKTAGRKHCGCMKSVDIGKYDSCIHNCCYCYANVSKDKAIANYKSHDPMSPML